jgi:uncharacterized membrane protein YedE/YeeE
VCVLVSLVSGVIFGLGLALSGMIDPARVLGFLDVAGAWDPSLAFTMGGALLVTVPCFGIARRQLGPWAAGGFQWPTRTDIDVPLVAGAVLFGVGWGIAGFCPGPALASLGLGHAASYPLVLALLGGTLLGRALLYVGSTRMEPHAGEGIS